jgi:hypothetical protein
MSVLQTITSNASWDNAEKCNVPHRGPCGAILIQVTDSDAEKDAKPVPCAGEFIVRKIKHISIGADGN